MMGQFCILIVVSVTQIHKCNKIEQNHTHTHVKLVHSEFCGSYNLYFLVLISCYIYVGFTIRRAVHRTSLYYFFQFSSAAQSCPTLCKPVDCSTPGFPVHHQFPELLKLMSITSVMPSNHLLFCRPLLLPPSIFPSIRVFSNESVLRIR